MMGFASRSSAVCWQRLEGCVADEVSTQQEECPDRLETSALGEGEGGGVYAVYCHLPAMAAPAPD